VNDPLTRIDECVYCIKLSHHDGHEVHAGLINERHGKR
jgi:hypothetical protein